ncbi:MAG: hypothetical protein LBJ12_07375 [Oscillospiraceae bacterium]|nr:hypothetical protein [Oscillospiraceae bacterium]
MKRRTLCVLAAIMLLSLTLTGCITKQSSPGINTNPSVAASDNQLSQTDSAAQPSQSNASTVTEPINKTAALTTGSGRAVPTTTNSYNITTATKPSAITTAPPMSTAATKPTEKPAQMVAQVATYPSCSFYKAIKANRFYMQASNAITNKESGEKKLQIVTMAADGIKQYTKIEVKGEKNSVAYYTADGKTMHMLVNMSGVKLDLAEELDEKGKATFGSISSDFTEYGIYVKTTIEGDTIAEHYKLGDKTKRYIFQKKNDNKLGAVIGLETESSKSFAKATITTFNFSPSDSLFKTPKEYKPMSAKQK